jgi:hypothetical protein
LASYAIEIAWWKELGQFHTWLSMLYYSVAPSRWPRCWRSPPVDRACARPQIRRNLLGEHRIYARISALVLLLVGYLIAASAIDTWTVVRFAGSRGLPAAATGGTTRCSTSRSPFTCSTCRSTACCAVTCWRW